MALKCCWTMLVRTCASWGSEKLIDGSQVVGGGVNGPVVVDPSCSISDRILLLQSKSFLYVFISLHEIGNCLRVVEEWWSKQKEGWSTSL